MVQRDRDRRAAPSRERLNTPRSPRRQTPRRFEPSRCSRGGGGPAAVLTPRGEASLLGSGTGAARCRVTRSRLLSPDPTHPSMPPNMVAAMALVRWLLSCPVRPPSRKGLVAVRARRGGGGARPLCFVYFPSPFPPPPLSTQSAGPLLPPRGRAGRALPPGWCSGEVR